MNGFFIQEWTPKALPPSWCIVDGTFCETREEAEALLEETKTGKLNYMGGSGKFRIFEYLDENHPDPAGVPPNPESEIPPAGVS